MRGARFHYCQTNLQVFLLLLWQWGVSRDGEVCHVTVRCVTWRWGMSRDDEACHVTVRCVTWRWGVSEVTLTSCLETLGARVSCGDTRYWSLPWLGSVFCWYISCDVSLIGTYYLMYFSLLEVFVAVKWLLIHPMSDSLIFVIQYSRTLLILTTTCQFGSFKYFKGS